MIQTTHNLPFEVGGLFVGIETEVYIRFKVGTCYGLYRTKNKNYEILAIKNESKGNGHLDDVFEWFEYSCKRDNYNLVILCVLNSRFEKHLIEKREFKRLNKVDLIKKFGTE